MVIWLSALSQLKAKRTVVEERERERETCSFSLTDAPQRLFEVDSRGYDVLEDIEEAFAYIFLVELLWNM